jgi:hypothetical protein
MEIVLSLGKLVKMVVAGMGIAVMVNGIHIQIKYV